jgi:DNA-binding MarR family transcriptional regulator
MLEDLYTEVRVSDEPPPNTQDLIKRIIYSIRKLIQASEIHTKELNKKYRISTPQLNCLLALNEKGSLPPSQIAKYIMVNSSTVTGIIDRLEQKGLVKRVRKKSDRRLISIELTEAGLLLVQKAPPPIQLEIMDGLNKLEITQLNHISSGLDMLITMLDKHYLKVSRSNSKKIS